MTEPPHIPFERRSWHAEEDRIDEFLSDLDLLASKAADTAISHTDPDGMVTVIVNGFGHVLDIKFHPSAMNSQRNLGQVVTDTLAKAWAESELMSGDRQEMERILEILNGPRPSYDFRYDNPELAPREAEIMECLTAMLTLSREHENRYVEHKIGRGLGRVSSNLAGEDIKVEIVPGSLRTVKLTTLAKSTVQAVEEVRDRAAQIRESELVSLRQVHERRMI